MLKRLTSANGLFWLTVLGAVTAVLCCMIGSLAWWLTGKHGEIETYWQVTFVVALASFAFGTFGTVVYKRAHTEAFAEGRLVGYAAGRNRGYADGSQVTREGFERVIGNLLHGKPVRIVHCAEGLYQVLGVTTCQSPCDEDAHGHEPHFLCVVQHYVAQDGEARAKGTPRLVLMPSLDGTIGLSEDDFFRLDLRTGMRPRIARI